MPRIIDEMRHETETTAWSTKRMHAWGMQARKLLYTRLTINESQMNLIALHETHSLATIVNL